MDTGEVKIKSTGTGHNGIRHMTYDRKVADFNTFIKSPDKFTKPTSEKNDDKLHPQGKDKDFKQLFAKIKYVGEQITALTAEIAKDPTKATALNEKIAEMTELNKQLLEFAQPTAQPGAQGGAEGGYKAKLQAKIEELVQKLPDDKLEQLATEVAPKIEGKSQEEIQSMIEPEAQKAQEIVDRAKAEVAVEESLLIEGFPSFTGDWFKKALNVALTGAAGLGAAAFFVSTIAWGVTDGHPGELLKMIGEFGGFGALVSFILMGISTAIQSAREVRAKGKK